MQPATLAAPHPLALVRPCSDPWLCGTRPPGLASWMASSPAPPSTPLPRLPCLPPRKGPAAARFGCCCCCWARADLSAAQLEPTPGSKEGGGYQLQGVCLVLHLRKTHDSKAMHMATFQSLMTFNQQAPRYVDSAGDCAPHVGAPAQPACQRVQQARCASPAPSADLGGTGSTSVGMRGTAGLAGSADAAATAAALLLGPVSFRFFFGGLAGPPRPPPPAAACPALSVGVPSGWPAPPEPTLPCWCWCCSRCAGPSLLAFFCFFFSPPGPPLARASGSAASSF